MAPLVGSVRSEKVLNVSQGAVSSPQPSENESDTAQITASIEVVEDSCQYDTTAYRGGAVQSPQRHQRNGEDEDLYGATPDAKHAFDANKNGGNQDGTEGTIDSEAARQQAKTRLETQTKKHSALSIPVNAVDRLLMTGATVRHSSGLQTPGVSGNKVTRTTIHTAQPSAATRLKAQWSAQVNGTGSATPAITPFPCLADKVGSNAGTTGPESRSNRIRSPKATEHEFSQPRSSAATGKLRAPQKTTPVARESMAQTVNDTLIPNHKRDGPHAIQSSGIEVEARSVKKRLPQCTAAKATAVEAPSRKQPNRRAKQDAVVDQSDSSDAELNAESDGSQYRPPKKARVSKAGSLSKRTGRPSSATKATTEAAPLQQRFNSRANARPRQGQGTRSKAQNDVDSTKPPTAKNRMKIASSQVSVQPPVLHQKKQTTTPSSNFDEADKENVHHGAVSRPRVDEPLVDFERPVVEYDDDSGSYQVDHGAAEITSPPRRVPDAFPPGQQQQSLASGWNTLQGRQQLRSHGASQENAIILSDGPSSVPASPTSDRQRSSPIRAIHETAKARPPGTPIMEVLLSSPPQPVEELGTTATKAHVGLDTAKKPTIISFSKSGPRNQGSLLPEKGDTWSLRTGHSYLPPHGVPTTSEPSSRTRPQSNCATGQTSQVAGMTSSRTEKTAPPKNVAPDVPDALAGFLSAKAVPMQKTISKHSPVRSTWNEAQQQPPPSAVQDDDGYVNVHDFDCPTIIAEETTDQYEMTREQASHRTVSERAMPPPATTRQSHPVSEVTEHQRPCQETTEAPTREANRALEPSKGAVSSIPSERSVGDSYAEASISKRPRVVEEPNFSYQKGPDKLANYASRPLPPPKLAKDEDRRSIEQVNDVTRKPTRNATFGSKSVDIQGSPIPDGFVVQGSATALDTFSQRIDLSSDMLSVDAVVMRKASSPPQRTIATNFKRLAPPSAQPQLLSSNKKQQPAPPQEHSRAITSIGKTEKGRLVVEDQAAALGTDPFTGSCEAQDKLPGKSPSSFAEQLRLFTAGEQSIFKKAARAEEEDPDKTLVAPLLPQSLKRLLSDSTDSSSDQSSQGDDPKARAMHDIGVWRDGLRPHQVNLFDELVNVSHRLVRHLVDSETAATDAVEDYRRRGLRLVDQMEVSQVAEYRQYISTLKERKKRLRKDLGYCSQKLREATNAVVAGKHIQNKHKRAKIHESETLQNILAQYC